jgi:hypothetical protein
MNKRVAAAVAGIIALWSGGAAAATLQVERPGPLSVSAPGISQFDLRSYERLSDSGKLLVDLDNALWIPDGPPSDRHVYISFSPWSTESRDLYIATRENRPAGVQLRWLPSGARDPGSRREIMALAATRDPAVLENLFLRHGIESDFEATDFAERAADYQEGLRRGLELYADRNREAPPTYPSLVIPTRDGVLMVGDIHSQALTRVLEQAWPRPASRDPVPAASRFLRRDFEVERMESGESYINVVTDEQDVFLLPFSGSGRLGRLALNAPLPFTGRVVRSGTESDWIQVRPSPGSGIQGYVRAPVDAVMSTLHIPEIPLRHDNYRAVRATVVRAYPTTSAPVVGHIRHGQRFIAFAAVEQDGKRWLRLRFFGDGKDAFVDADDMENTHDADWDAYPELRSLR